MAILIKDKAHHLLLECWAEHHYITNGYKPKVFEHPIPSNFFKNGGKTFKDVKPIQFIIVDNVVEEWINSPLRNPRYAKEAKKMIELADNRMLMGDYKYGLITRQNLSIYDTNEEYSIRLQLAYDNKSLEYLIDAYNMCRIQFLKDGINHIARERARYITHIYTVHKISDGWTLNTIDDGHHAEPTT